MDKLVEIKALRRSIRNLFSKLQTLVPQGSYDEFSKEELIMIATGLDEVMPLIEEIENKVALLNTKIEHIENDLTSMETNMTTSLSEKADVNHTHNDIVETVNNKSDLSHTHDDRYYTESEIDTKLATKANTSHTHTEYASISHTHNYAATDHTHDIMTAATSSTAGTSGLVPAPEAGKQDTFLKGDGTWAELPMPGFELVGSGTITTGNTDRVKLTNQFTEIYVVYGHMTNLSFSSKKNLDYVHLIKQSEGSFKVDFNEINLTIEYSTPPAMPGMDRIPYVDIIVSALPATDDGVTTTTTIDYEVYCR